MFPKNQNQRQQDTTNNATPTKTQKTHNGVREVIGHRDPLSNFYS